jgi:ABC-type Fe3+/spermidine/putrescine transport system ATPase subunit
VRKAEGIVVLGPSGSGKSTVPRCLGTDDGVVLIGEALHDVHVLTAGFLRIPVDVRLSG